MFTKNYNILGIYYKVQFELSIILYLLEHFYHTLNINIENSFKHK